MTLTILDIVMFSLSAIVVIIYLVISIRNLHKFKKEYAKNIANGMTDKQARLEATKKCYPRKYKKNIKKLEKSNQKEDVIYED